MHCFDSGLCIASCGIPLRTYVFLLDSVSHLRLPTTSAPPPYLFPRPQCEPRSPISIDTALLGIPFLVDVFCESRLGVSRMVQWRSRRQGQIYQCHAFIMSRFSRRSSGHREIFLHIEVDLVTLLTIQGLFLFYLLLMLTTRQGTYDSCLKVMLNPQRFFLPCHT